MKIEAIGQIKLLLLCTMFLGISGYLGWDAARFGLFGELAMATVVRKTEYPPRVEFTYTYNDQGVLRTGVNLAPRGSDAQPPTIAIRYIPGTDKSYIGTNSPPWIYYVLPVIAAALFVWRVSKFRIAHTN